MGQKMDFNPDDWDVLDEISSEQDDFDSSISIEVNPEFDELDLAQEPSAFDQEPSAYDQEPSAYDREPSAFEQEDQEPIFIDEPLELVKELARSLDKDSDQPQEKRIYFTRKVSGNLDLQQEQDAFKKQIEDLFELLELEKVTDKSQGIRVYQTDSSPSMPWRFH